MLSLAKSSFIQQNKKLEQKENQFILELSQLENQLENIHLRNKDELQRIEEKLSLSTAKGLIGLLIFGCVFFYFFIQGTSGRNFPFLGMIAIAVLMCLPTLFLAHIFPYMC